jgi:hypothetical protein
MTELARQRAMAWFERELRAEHPGVHWEVVEVDVHPNRLALYTAESQVASYVGEYPSPELIANLILLAEGPTADRPRVWVEGHEQRVRYPTHGRAADPNQCIAQTEPGHQCSRTAYSGLYCDQHSQGHRPTSLESPAAMGESVYFIRRRVGEPIKIGKSRAGGKQRLSDGQCWHWERLHILRAVDGPPGLEDALHDRFCDERIEVPTNGRTRHTEWFEPAPPLLRLITTKTDEQIRRVHPGYRKGSENWRPEVGIHRRRAWARWLLSHIAYEREEQAA